MRRGRPGSIVCSFLSTSPRTRRDEQPRTGRFVFSFSFPLPQPLLVPVRRNSVYLKSGIAIPPGIKLCLQYFPEPPIFTRRTPPPPAPLKFMLLRLPQSLPETTQDSRSSTRYLFTGSPLSCLSSLSVVVVIDAWKRFTILLLLLLLLLLSLYIYFISCCHWECYRVHYL